VNAKLYQNKYSKRDDRKRETGQVGTELQDGKLGKRRVGPMDRQMLVYPSVLFKYSGLSLSLAKILLVSNYTNYFVSFCAANFI